ncbi:MAG: hypothetical protein RLZZ210_762 [Pseudomonadota bacterium]|jgi:hypothetical protein
MDISQIAGLTNSASLGNLSGDVGSIDISQFLGTQSSAFGGFDMSSIMGGNFDINSIMGGFDMSSIMGGNFDINSIMSGFDMSSIMGGNFDINSLLGGGGILGGAAAINASSVGDSEFPIPTTTPKPKPTSTPSSTTSSSSSSGGSGEFSNVTTGGKGSEGSNQRAVEVRDRLMKDYGLTKEQASGIVGNLYHESDGMKSDVNEYSGGGGFGWAQWTGSRRSQMESWCKSNGYDPNSAEGNYQFLKYELDNVETGTIPAVKSASTAEEAAMAFERNFERAASPVMAERLKWANAINNM